MLFREFNLFKKKRKNTPRCLIFTAPKGYCPRVPPVGRVRVKSTGQPTKYQIPNQNQTYTKTVLPIVNRLVFFQPVLSASFFGCKSRLSVGHVWQDALVRWFMAKGPNNMKQWCHIFKWGDTFFPPKTFQVLNFSFFWKAFERLK